MSVEQRVKISCDHFDCDAVVYSDRGITDARAMTGLAGWVNTVHDIGLRPSKTILQDLYPEHREQAFDWRTCRAAENATDVEVADGADSADSENRAEPKQDATCAEWCIHRYACAPLSQPAL